jgi:5-methyltetrahydrofolate--homocysteine methyltransferase
MTESAYLAALRDRVLVFDGAMGTSVQRYDLDAEAFGGCMGCNDYLPMTRPEVIEEIHASFMEVGCDVLETDTFGGNRLKLDEYGLGARTHEINFGAAQLARRVADRYSTPDHPRFVAGSMGPTGMLPSSDDPTLSNITFDQLVEIFYEQSKALVEGGVDLLIIETTQDILELKAAIIGANRYFKDSGRWVPIQAQVTLDVTGRMLLGTDIAAALTTLETLAVDVIGLNCSTGPEHMREPIRYLAEHCSKPVSCIPNAGLPLNQNGQAVYPLEPVPMAETLAEFVNELGVEVVGGCCGTTPEHLAELVKRVGGKKRAPRQVARTPAISSGMRSVDLHQVPAPLIVGERVNAQGSRKVKRLLLANDYDGILGVAREQVEGGAHALDVTVALTERTDEDAQMVAVIKKLRAGVEAPIVIDSTEANVIEAALKAYPGRPVVNSINMERGRERIEAVVPNVVEHGAAVVVMPIDEVGMAKTADKKAEVCKRIFDICVNEYGLPADSIIFDVLTFPVTTGQEDLVDAAIQTLEGIRQAKAACPGSLSILGVSNVSFGLTPHARAVLNSVFLHHAVQAGLDLAIVHPSHVVPYTEVPADQRELADDLLLARRPDALPRYIAYFEENKPQEGGQETAADPTEGMTVEEKIHWQILHRRKDGIEALLDEAITHQDPVGVLNNVLLPAMKDVGDKFGAGELILPFVLQSAEVMKKAVAHLEQYFEKKEGYTKGKVVVATVFGDVHDIGKSLVNTILTNNGYTVYDLGKQVPINVIIDRALEVQADAIGLSALLVNTSKQMPLCVQELAKRNLEIPVLIGGAAINRNFGRRIGFVNDGERYTPGVYYCRDAFEGLDTMEALSGQERAAFVERKHREAIIAAEREVSEEELLAEAAARPKPARSPKVRTDVPIPTPPFWGWRVVDPIPAADMFACLDLNSLFRLSWGAKSLKGERWDTLLREDFLPRLERLKTELIQSRALQPRMIYGYYPCQSAGDQVIVYDPTDPQARREITRFTFPRQPDRDFLAHSDYFADVDSGRIDVIGLQCVTVGDRVSELTAEWNRAGNYTEAYYLHGLSVACAEALAEYGQGRFREELGLDPNQGRRYSWGYPACPDTMEHYRLLEALPFDRTIGVTLTTAGQLSPEQSTAALVTHHPQSKYYTTRPVRQLRNGAAGAGEDGDEGTDEAGAGPTAPLLIPQAAGVE